MSPTPRTPASGGDDFNKRIRAEQAKMAGRPPAQQPSQPDTQQAEATKSQAEGDQEQAQDQVTGPVGSGDYEVRQGDCISSIAMEHGFAPDTIWNDAGNTELRDVRKNPNVLLPGDRVTIPALRPKDEPCDTEMRHQFRLKGQPETLRIRLLDEFGEPRENLPYLLIIDRHDQRRNTTNEDGELNESIPPNARKAQLILDEGDEEYDLDLGGLDPVSEINGIQQRLVNLGFDVGAPDGILGSRTREAIKEFQDQRDLKPTGNPDRATQDALEEDHGH